MGFFFFFFFLFCLFCLVWFGLGFFFFFFGGGGGGCALACTQSRVRVHQSLSRTHSSLGIPEKIALLAIFKHSLLRKAVHVSFATSYVITFLSPVFVEDLYVGVSLNM